MRKYYFLVLLFSFSPSYGQSWDWGRQGYGSIKENGYASPIATDKDGNAYITGRYETTIIFGNDTLNSIAATAYLTKYSSAGKVIWARQIIDSLDDEGSSVATDIAGNIYITGYFEGNAQIGSFLLKGYNGEAFLVKYDANGTVLWAKQSETPRGYGYGSALSVATDKFGNVYITGNYGGAVSFGNFTLNATSVYNVFLVKYDSNGNVLWANQSGALSKYSIGNSVVADNMGNSYITGYFEDTLYFGATMLINSQGTYSGFLAKYSSIGNLLWAKQTTNGSINSICTPNSVISDGADNAYITGNFGDTVHFGSKVLISPSAAFLTKYDTNGNVIWVRQSSPGLIGTGLVCDEFSNVYMAGMTNVTGNPDSLKFGGYKLYTASGEYSFLLKFDTSGNAVCGSILDDVGFQGITLSGIASDYTGTYLYMASVFNYSVFCGPDTLFAKGGGYNTFVGRWQNCNIGQGINKIPSQKNSISLFPNPNNGTFQLEISHADPASGETASQPIVEIYNILGEKVLNETLKQSRYLSGQGDNTINLSNQPNGIYLYRVLNESGGLIGEGKVIIQK